MTKETVRFPDDLVDSIKSAVDESDLFESRSEFHRVSTELLLDMLDPDHEPTNFSYRELRAEIEQEVGVSLDGRAGSDSQPSWGDDDFLEAYVTARRRALHGDLEGARELVSEHYDPVSVEALLLDEVIGLHRSERPREDPGPEAGGVGPELGMTDGSGPAGDQYPTDADSDTGSDSAPGSGADSDDDSRVEPRRHPR